ncbi:zinc finger protein 772-like [Equus quagga]|uniref:zinc finger protein 772-like n=1 Tax=Equus quagga TaxID=89248 RepID=UPI001EE31F73|nr:zinc finger protein 772-like [Equus quagga]
MVDVAVQTEPPEGFVSLDDVLIFFSREEWELLDEAQKRLYYRVMLETVGLAISVRLGNSKFPEITQPEPERVFRVPDSVDAALGKTEMTWGNLNTSSWHTVEAEDASSEQGVTARVSQESSLEVGPSIQNSHPCDMCDPILKYILCVAGHEETSPGQPLYPCMSCGRSFWFSANLDQIQKEQSGELLPRIENVRTISVESWENQMSEAFPFGEGEEDFLASSGLAQLDATEDGKTPHRSAEYEEAFHTGQMDYKCSESGEASSHKDEFVQHQNIHMGETYDECSECGKSFSQRAYFLLHKKSHLKAKPYKCSDCGKAFCHKFSLKVHQSHHTGFRPYECTECGKSFIKRYQFVQHQQVHTGAKPYNCSECGKVFSRRDTLTEHQRIHSGIKPFMCGVCGKAFLRKRALGKHEKIHTGEKPYKCDECGKFFRHRSCLSRHKKIHSKTEPSAYACAECDKTFITNFNLIRHKKIHARALRLVGEVKVENSLVAT